MIRITGLTLVLGVAAAFAQAPAPTPQPKPPTVVQDPPTQPAGNPQVGGAGGGQRGNAGNPGGGGVILPNPHPRPGSCLPGIDMRQPLAGAQTIRNRFDASAPKPAPYIEAQFADGSVRRLRPNGDLDVQQPGQASVSCVPGYQFIDAPAPAMPDLPANSPSQARKWLDYQNNSLQRLIQTLVKNDPAELQAISDGERKEAGTNVYSQIVFRTSIASFYASRQQ